MPQNIIKSSIVVAWIALPAALMTTEAHALTFIDDRVGFNASFTTNAGSSIIDSNGAFAADPSSASGLASITRTGTVGGQALSYTIYDIDFSNSPNGSITPGSTGGDIDQLDNLNLESPASQGGAAGTGSWGIDSSSGASSTRNAALFEFDRAIGHFGLDLHDFESAAGGTLGELRLYRNGSLLSSLSQPIGWSDDGNNVSHFLGFVAENPNELFDTIAFVLGDDDLGGTGRTERWAADGFTFGDASAISSTATPAAATAVPTPALLPGLIGFGASLIRKKRQTK